MPCVNPMPAFRTDAGDVVMVERGAIHSSLTLPCGRCVGCRLERSRMWATRIMFESQMHLRSSFLTLTYDPANVPSPPSLYYPHVQLFLKRLRKRLGKPLRFYCVGEYGEEHGRPHYHMILFGEDFREDRYFWRMRGDNKCWRSPLLESIWTLGNSEFGSVTFESAAYCARYVMKKVTGDLAEHHYAFTDPETGEVSMLTLEFSRMSLKPGIGGAWFDKYSSDVYGGHDFVVINGRKCKPPRYFDKLYKRFDKDAHSELKTQREFRAYKHHLNGENLAPRIAAREAVMKAAISTLKRKL